MLSRFLGQNWPFLLAALALAFGAFQWNRADNAVTLAEAREKTIGSLNAIVASRDAFIGLQNDAIQSLADRRNEGRTIYLRDYARADAAAVTHDNHAAELLALQTEFTDELSECRAATALLQKELLP